jgi:hypothetical protein
MHYHILLPMLLLCPAISAPAQVSIGINLPGLSIGINQPVYPELVPVPGYPVYYAPSAAGNYFFYDGMYWVYQNDNWYSSEWYNGPWGQVYPDAVPLYLLRVPVSYYRQPPAYFGGWDRNAAPQWGAHWGHDWEQRRSGWDHWDRHADPSRAPLPTYQRQFSGGRYPAAAQQQALHTENYHYQPKEAVVRERYQKQQAPAPAPQHPQPAPMPQHQQPAPAPQHQQPMPGLQHQQPAPVPAPQHQQPAPAPQHQQPAPQHQQPAPVPVPQHQQPTPAPQHQQPTPAPAPQHERPAPAPRPASPMPPPPENRQPQQHQGQAPEPQGKGPQHEPGKGPGQN